VQREQQEQLAREQRGQRDQQAQRVRLAQLEQRGQRGQLAQEQRGQRDQQAQRDLLVKAVHYLITGRVLPLQYYLQLDQYQMVTFCGIMLPKLTLLRLHFLISMTMEMILMYSFRCTKMEILLLFKTGVIQLTSKNGKLMALQL
jgi:hypothetical protein